MYKNKRFLAVIPARGGSKGIKNKNIINVAGKPLIQYTIDEAIKSTLLDKVIVSTDSEDIAYVAKQCGADVPFLRPLEMAGDHAKTIDAIVHAVGQLEQRNEFFDFVMLLQPTQPLRRAWHIDEAILSMIDNHYPSLVSVSLVKDHPLLMRSLQTDGSLKKMLPENSSVRRQDFANFYKVNGAIYINKIDQELNKHLSLNDNHYGYVMDSRYDLDVDDQVDLHLLNVLIRSEDHRL